MNNDLQEIATDIAEIKEALLFVLMNKKVLTFDEGCRYTGFAPSYMYKLTSAGRIPFSKPNGKTIFFDRDKLDEFLLSNSTKSNDQKEAEAATYVSTHN